MAAITEAILKKQMDEGRFSRVYLVYGDEKYYVSLYARRLMQKAGGERFPQFNLQVFAEDIDLSKVASAVEAVPFMAETKCVVLQDWDAEACGTEKTEALKEIISQVPEGVVLLLYYPTLSFESKRAMKFKKLLELVNKYGDTLEFATKTQAELEKLLCAYAAKRKCTLSRQNAAKIIFSAGTDVNVLYSEMEKLCAFCMEKGEIAEEDIATLTTRNMETTVYKLSQAIVVCDLDAAYKSLDTLFFEGEEPVSVLAVLAGTFIDMYRVRMSVRSGKPVTFPAQYGDYRGREFRLQNAQRDSRELTDGALREILDVLLETDLQIKGSRTDGRTVLEEMIARLLQITKKGSIH